MIATDPTTNGRCNPDRSPSSDSSESGEGSSFWTDESAASETQRPDPIGPLLVHLAELREYVGLYCAARIDQWRLNARSLLLKAAFGLIAALFGITALIVAAGLFVNGLATGVGNLCGGHIWLGQILVGGLLMLVAFGGLGAGMRFLRIAEHRRVVDKYETRKRRERATFGTNVAERAMGRGAE